MTGNTHTKFNGIHNAYLHILDKNLMHECHDLYWIKSKKHLVDLIDAIVNVHLKHNRDTAIAEISIEIDNVGEQSAEFCKEIKQDLDDRLLIEGVYFTIEVNHREKA